MIPNFGGKFKLQMQKANVIGSALNPSLQRPCWNLNSYTLYKPGEDVATVETYSDTHFAKYA